MSDLEITDRPSPEDVEFLARGIKDFMRAAFPRSIDERLLAVFARTRGGSLAGGLSGTTGKDEFFISDVFVDEQERRRGLGTQLMRAGEAEARARGCHAAWLMTSSEDAKAFYEKLGYKVFGAVERRTPSPPRYFLSKVL